MKRTSQILRYIVIALVIAMLGALLGWYLYIHSKQSSIQATDVGRGLTTTPGSTPSFGDGSNVLPNGTQGGVGDNPLSSTQDFTATSSSALWKIEKNPVAGFGFITASSTPTLEYITRANGYVAQAIPAERTTSRLTTNALPKIYEAFVAEDASVVLRSIGADGSLTTFLGTMRTATSSDSLKPETTLAGTYLSPNIRHLSLNTRTKVLTYSLDTAQGESILSSVWPGTKPKTLFTAAVTNWMILTPADGRIFITEAPSSGLTGYAYELKNASALSFGEGSGLIILPQPNGTGVLWSTSTKEGLSLFAQPTSKDPIVTLSVRTVATKCVWAPSKIPTIYCAVPQSSSGDNLILDDWFAGLTHTSDSWWKIDVTSGVAQSILTQSASSGILDVEDPQIDSSGNFIAFLNGRDGSLWSLKITQ